MKRLTLAKLLAVGSVLFGASFIFNPNLVHADALPDVVAVNPTIVSPDCTDSTNNVIRWTATNPGTDPVTVDWTTDDGTASGTVAAPTGDSQFTTPYDSTKPAESFIFSQAGQDDVTYHAPEAICEAPETPPCVDGTDPANLQFTVSPLGTASIQTVNGGLLCEDVTVYFSSYILPLTNDHTGIFNDSAVPQSLLDSTSVVLSAGTTGSQTLQVNIPNACLDYQLDLYYAPEITVVTAAGHGAQLLFGRIYLASDTDCTVNPGQGGKGAGGDPTPPADNPPVTPTPTPTPVAAPAAPVAAKLADTGTQTWLTTAFGVVLLTSGIAVRFAYTGRRGA